MGYVGLFVGLFNLWFNMDQLCIGSLMNEQCIMFKVFMYQGYFWDDMIIFFFGWCWDMIRQCGNVLEEDFVIGFYWKIESIVDMGIEIMVMLKSYGVVFYLLKVIKKKLLEGMDVSFYYFYGFNEILKVCYVIDGF